MAHRKHDCEKLGVAVRRRAPVLRVASRLRARERRHSSVDTRARRSYSRHIAGQEGGWVLRGGGRAADSNCRTGRKLRVLINVYISIVFRIVRFILRAFLIVYRVLFFSIVSVL